MIWPDPVSTLLGGVAAFAFGSIYYLVLSGPWRRAAGVSADVARPTPSRLAFMLIFNGLIAGGVGWFLATIGIKNSVPSAVIVMAIAWLTLVFAPIAVNHRAQGRSWSLTVIDTVHWLAVIEIAALVHVSWAGTPKFG